ncbi:hypothetical protein MINTM008_55500 (plasmid) [Mycobacterium intracellulare]|nr:hypothetical protein MINTM002_52310 [Mycobacterium intracellulare]BCO65380.1 hypothetical protein MINTM006_53300 [Mycobacterium intracellulare]BCO76215.1 hypothetical protein MINTM008_55500 [Mycobacterium intracellulare]BCP23622.1 hypothetical protein MINTM023_54110 [Mycobacterium intracellulare]BCP29012.1 hypothetical protein MINTM025_53680 [Mycobacterium intracellulare]
MPNNPQPRPPKGDVTGGISHLVGLAPARTEPRFHIRITARNQPQRLPSRDRFPERGSPFPELPVSAPIA